MTPLSKLFRFFNFANNSKLESWIFLYAKSLIIKSASTAIVSKDPFKNIEPVALPLDRVSDQKLFIKLVEASVNDKSRFINSSL